MNSIMDNRLLSERLIPIPDTFSSVQQFYYTLYPYLLEELRAQIEGLALKDFNGVKRYKVSFKRKKKKINHPCDFEDLVIQLETQEEIGDVKDMAHELGILVHKCPEKLTLSNLVHHRYSLCNIVHAFDEQSSETSIEFKAEFPKSDITDEIVQNRCNDWDLFILGVGTLPGRRICTALGRMDDPRQIMEDILSGATTYTPHRALLSAAQRHCSLTILGKLVGNLNESQVIAIRRVLDVGCPRSAPIQLIKGPPGTGKTNTLAALLKSLVAGKQRIHASAPTNTAVCELARRCLESIQGYRYWKTESEQNNGMEWRYSDIILIGNKKRLNIMEDDLQNPLRHILMDYRVKEVESVKKLFRQSVFNLESFLTSPSLKQDLKIEKEEALKKQAVGVIVNIVPKKSEILVHLVTSIDDMLFTLFNKIPMDSVSGGSAFLKCHSEYLHRLIDSTDVALEDEPMMLATLTALKQIDTTVDQHKLHTLASLVFSTVNQGGSYQFNELNFDVAVVDEATQLNLAETSIVLRDPLKVLILAGDDMQLPAMITSDLCKTNGFGVSLFSRLVSKEYPLSLLNTQYRMHPSISRWPRSQFYNGDVVDGDNVKSEQYVMPWHNEFPPFSVFDLAEGEEARNLFGSKYNEAEVILVKQIMRRFRALKSRAISVGIISPYAEQVDILADLATPLNYNPTIRVNTIDGFQGQECDVIIISAVRANSQGKIGFLSDERRLNVAITRAKYCLIVICNCKTVSKNSVWKSLIEHASQQRCLYNSANCEVIKSSAQKFQRSGERFRQLLTPKSSIFENAAWSVVFTSDLKTSLSGMDHEARQRVFNAMVNLANGERPKKEFSCPQISVKFSDVIHVYRIQQISHFRLVWSTDVCLVKRSQILKIWNVCLSSDLTQAIRRVEGAMRYFSVEHLNRCREKCINSRKLHIPQHWSPEIDISELEPVRQGSHAEEGTDVGQVSEAAILMKFYPLSSSTARLLISSKDYHQIELPFKMGEEEERIVKHDGSMLVLGRSGTGKTTTILQRMFLESKLGDKAASLSTFSGSNMDFTCRQLLLTASPLLCDSIRKAYRKMCKTVDASNDSCALEKIEPLVVGMFSESGDSEFVIPKSFVDCDAKYFPLIITYKDFVRLLDACLESPFFQDCTHPSFDQSLYTVTESNREVPNRRTGAEVDFERFTTHYFPHFGDIQSIDASAMYTEIMSHIKGSLASLHTPHGYISEQSYLALSRQRESTLKEDTRKLIYDFFLKYNRRKIMNNDHDILDVVHHIYRSLTEKHLTFDKMSSVFVDEVQDLSPAQIALFKFVCDNDRGFLFAGDTAQTIAHGVGFRFESVKDIFFSEFLSEYDRDTAKDLMPKLWHLRKNFRTHAGVVNIANSVVEAICKFFPNSIDKLEPESSQVGGPLPIVLGCAGDLATSLFGASDSSSSCDFGAEQVILVRDEIAKAKVKEVSESKALVLTVLEAKGMEFNDCLVYNFFSSSDIGNSWRILYELIDGCEEVGPKFDMLKHSGLCVELKMLYVLLTRTRQNLIIFDSNRKLFTPMLKYWESLSLVEYKILDENIRSMFRLSSSAEEWKQRGVVLFERKQYSNARHCYMRAKDTYHERLCAAAEKEQQANRTLAKSEEKAKKEFIMAALIYLEIVGYKSSAARCYDEAGEYKLAAALFLELQQYEKAARCFELLSLWDEAADAHSRYGNVNSCIHACYSGELFDAALAFLLEFSRQEKLITEEYNKKRLQCVKSAATHFYNQDNSTRMMEYVQMFPSYSDKRAFLLRFDCLANILEIELTEGRFKDAGSIYEKLFKYSEAGECYERANLIDDAVRCIIKSVRMQNLDGLYLPKRLALTFIDELNSVRVLAAGCSAKKAIDLEIDLLICGPESSIEAYLSIMNSARDLGDIAWRIELTAARLCLIHCAASQDWKTHLHCTKAVERLVGEMLGPLQRLRTGSMKELTVTERRKLLRCFDMFELVMEAEPHLTRVVLGSPIHSDGLQRVFGLSHVKEVRIDVSSEFAQAVEKFFKLGLLDASIGICKMLILKAMDAMSIVTYANYNASLLLSSSQRPPLLHSTNDRIVAIYAWHELHQMGADTKLMTTNDLRAMRIYIVKLMLPLTPRFDDIQVIVAARKDPVISKYLLQYALEESESAKLKYEAICFSLLLGDCGNSLGPISEKLMRNIANELEKDKSFLGCECSSDVRWSLACAASWECAKPDSVPPGRNLGPFLYAIELGSSALINDIWRGSINAVGWNRRRPQGSKGTHGCVSPLVFLKLSEKYFVLSLLYAKKFTNTVLPWKLAVDILTKRNKAFSQVIVDYAHIVKQDSVVTDRMNVARKLKNDIIDNLWDLINGLTLDIFHNWNNGNASLHQISAPNRSKDESRDDLRVFLLHTVILILTDMCSASSVKDTRVQMSIKKINKALNTKDHVIKLLPHCFVSFLGKVGKCNNLLNMFSEFCRESDDGRPWLVNCNQGIKVPAFAINAKLISKLIVAVNAEKEGYCEVKIVDPITSYSTEESKESESEIHAGQEHPSKDSEAFAIEDDNTESMKSSSLNAAAAEFIPNAILASAVAPPTAEVEPEHFDRFSVYNAKLRQKLVSARAMVTSFTPLDKKVRQVERKFLEYNFFRTHQFVKHYTIVLCPLLLDIEHYVDRIKYFIENKKSKSKKAVELNTAYDTLDDLQQVITDLEPPCGLLDGFADVNAKISALAIAAQTIINRVRKDSVLLSIMSASTRVKTQK